MKKAPQIKQLALVAISAFVLVAAVSGVALAAPCLVPTPDCPPSDCG